jgi:molybdopterin converting factor small subunit
VNAALGAGRGIGAAPVELKFGLPGADRLAAERPDWEIHGSRRRRTPALRRHRPAATNLTRTMDVTVSVPSVLRSHCGGRSSLVVKAESVRASLTELKRSHPSLHVCVCDETGAVRRHINIFVGSAHVRDLGGLDTPLAQGDVITILPAVSGG